MLFNSKGQQAHINPRLDSISNPGVFRPLREILTPSEKYCGTMFRMETRARIIDQRQHSHH